MATEFLVLIRGILYFKVNQILKNIFFENGIRGHLMCLLQSVRGTPRTRETDWPRVSQAGLKTRPPLSSMAIPPHCTNSFFPWGTMGQDTQKHKVPGGSASRASSQDITHLTSSLPTKLPCRVWKHTNPFPLPKASALGKTCSGLRSCLMWSWFGSTGPGLTRFHGLWSGLVSTFAFPAGEGWGGVPSVPELPSVLPPCGGPVGAEHPLRGLLSGREDLLPGVTAAAEGEESHSPRAEWGKGMTHRWLTEHHWQSSQQSYLGGILSISGRGSSNLSLSLRLWSSPGAHMPRSLLSTTSMLGCTSWCRVNSCSRARWSPYPRKQRGNDPWPAPRPAPTGPQPAKLWCV